MSDVSPWHLRVKALEDEWFQQAEQGIRDTYVYRYFDEADTLLYVGQTNSPSRRHSGHRAKSPWFDLVARRELRGPVTKAWALLEEFVSLGMESPRYNSQRRNGHTGPGSDHWAQARADEFHALMVEGSDIYAEHMCWLSGQLTEIFASSAP